MRAVVPSAASGSGRLLDRPVCVVVGCVFRLVYFFQFFFCSGLSGRLLSLPSSSWIAMALSLCGRVCEYGATWHQPSPPAAA